MASPSELSSELLEPRADDLIQSLRAFGYDAATALADLVDNSITARAEHVSINYSTNPGDSWVSILDDGRGMDEGELHEAMRFARSPAVVRSAGDLGRFGLGLKTASLSQAMKLSVLSRGPAGVLSARTWDIDHVLRTQEWRVGTTADDEAVATAERLGFEGTGTLVLWRKLDKLGEGPALSRRVSSAGRQLALLFHRYISSGQLRLSVGGHILEPNDPYLLRHPATQDLGTEVLEFDGHRVRINPVVIPHPVRLDREQLERASGPGGLMAHQGFYVYRDNRLVVAGGWLNLAGMGRTAPTRLARIAVDLDSMSDLAWEVDVRKSSVRPPAVVERRMIEIAEHTRQRSERVFTHRGTPVRGPKPDTAVQPVWHQVRRHGGTEYVVNRENPFVVRALAESPLVGEGLLRLVEASLPIDAIRQEALGASSATSTEKPVNDVLNLFRSILNGLSGDLQTRRELASAVAASEPFSRYPDLVQEITESTLAEEA